MKFYDKLMVLLENNNISQAVFLADMGYSYGAINSWRNGSRPRTDTMLRIAEYFEVTYESLSNDSMEIVTKKSEKNKYFSDEDRGEALPAKCPFCGERTVLEKIMVTFSYLSEHPLYEDGVDMDGVTMGQILGDPVNSPTFRCYGYRCISCGKKFDKSQYKFVKNAPDGNSFVKIEETPQRGKKGKGS